MKKSLAVVGSLLPLAAMADTNIDNLISTTQTTFASVAAVAVAITIFFVGKRLLKKGAS